MRIAIFTETFLPKLDGMVTVTCLLLEHLRRIHAEVMVFVPGSPVTEYVGYQVVGLGGIPSPMYPELSLAIPMKPTYQLLQDFNPDVIHVMNPVVAGVRGIQFAKRMNKPLMVTFHTHLMEMARFYGFGMFEGLLWQLHRWVYQQADCIMATSHHAQQDLIQHGFGWMPAAFPPIMLRMPCANGCWGEIRIPRFCYPPAGLRLKNKWSKSAMC